MTTLLSNWHFMRVFRAAIAVWIIVEVSRTGEWLLLIPGAIFAMQAIFDIGCCGASGCAAPGQKAYDQPAVTAGTEDVTYEEVK
jgi:hypothetical protein